MATSAADGNQAAEHPDAPVVVGVDGSEHAERALRWAIREAALRDAALTLVHAYRDAGITTASVAAARELGHRLVDDIAARHRGMLDELSGCDTVVAAHDAAQLLLDVGRRAQLIVMGTRGLGLFGELLLGSTSHRVLMHTGVPVALVRTPATADPRSAEELDGRRPIVVGVDRTPESRSALRWALAEASRRDVGVLAVHALDAPDAATLRVLGVPVELVGARLAEARSAALAAVDEQIATALPTGREVRLDRVIDDGAPVAALQRFATAEHLLVVGTRGRRAFAELSPGSVSHRCAHHIAGPMVAVPHRR